MELTTKQKRYISIAVIIIIGIIVVDYFYFNMRKVREVFSGMLKSSSRKLRATGTASCISSNDKTAVTNIQTQVVAIQNAVSALTPAPVSEPFLTTFNNAVTSINSQITTLLALPICCAGTNQVYSSTTNSCICASPYGLDSNGNCSISCYVPTSRI